MQRTTVVLPPALKKRAMRLSASRGVSFSETVRQALEAFVQQRAAEEPRDPMFADEAVFRDKGPHDMASRHDDYLYE